MSTDAYVSEPFVFQTLFVDPTGAPVTVLNPNITIFRFDPITGAEIRLVSAAPMSPVFPPEAGRFVFNYTIPGSLPAGSALYAEVRGTDPITAFVNVSSQTLNLLSRTDHGCKCGLNARFYR
jgi:hypothetical protein